jgi:hypothetical protein
MKQNRVLGTGEKAIPNIHYSLKVMVRCLDGWTAACGVTGVQYAVITPAYVTLHLPRLLFMAPSSCTFGYLPFLDLTSFATDRAEW